MIDNDATPKVRPKDTPTHFYNGWGWELKGPDWLSVEDARAQRKLAAECLKRKLSRRRNA